MKNEHEFEDEIDLLDVAHALVKRLWVIIAVGVAGALLFFTGTKAFIKPVYEAKSVVYVFDQSSNLSSINDLNIGTQLASDFQVLATSEPVLQGVIDKLGLSTTYSSLAGSISAQKIDGTRLLQLKVKNTDPQVAADIANAVAMSLSDMVAEIMENSHAYVAVPATKQDNPVSPSTKKNTVIGFIAGAAVVIMIVLLKYFLDKTIKNADDVKKYLGLPVLAEIPMDYVADGKTNNKHAKKKVQTKIKHKKAFR